MSVEQRRSWLDTVTWLVSLHEHLGTATGGDWLEVEAYALALDNATALHWAGRRPSFAVRAAGDLV